MDPARTAALAALLRVEEDAGYSNLVLNKTLIRFGLEPRDAAFASALFYGVLERQITLDYILAQFSNKPPQKMNAAVREILRMGAYQIVYLDKVPDSAAVNESVQLAKENGAPRASGFVNAVLRGLLRGRNAIHMPDVQKDPIAYLSVTHSCPEWLVKLWIASYGRDCAERLLSSLPGRAPLFLRVNTLRIDRESLAKRMRDEEFDVSLPALAEDCLRLEGAGAPDRLPGYEEGLFHVQDLSSQLCCALLCPQPGERVIDVCAAPGGKSFTMAQRMENRGELLAFDCYKGKVGLIRQGAQRLGLEIVHAAVRDALAPKQALPPADRVLCDAPCSGLGILRRKPEIRYKSITSLDSLPDLQYRILCSASELVKPGGRLVYSTCTLNPAENGGVADRFLREHADFQPVPLPLPKGMSCGIDEPDHQLTFMPHIHGTDGFFLAAFQRKQG